MSKKARVTIEASDSPSIGLGAVLMANEKRNRAPLSLFLTRVCNHVKLLGSYEDPFAIMGGVCLSACRVSRGLLGGIQ